MKPFFVWISKRNVTFQKKCYVSSQKELLEQSLAEGSLENGNKIHLVSRNNLNGENYQWIYGKYFIGNRVSCHIETEKDFERIDLVLPLTPSLGKYDATRLITLINNTKTIVNEEQKLGTYRLFFDAYKLIVSGVQEMNVSIITLSEEQTKSLFKKSLFGFENGAFSPHWVSLEGVEMTLMDSRPITVVSQPSLVGINYLSTVSDSLENIPKELQDISESKIDEYRVFGFVRVQGILKKGIHYVLDAQFQAQSLIFPLYNNYDPGEVTLFFTETFTWQGTQSLVFPGITLWNRSQDMEDQISQTQYGGDKGKAIIFRDVLTLFNPNENSIQCNVTLLTPSSSDSSNSVNGDFGTISSTTKWGIFEAKTVFDQIKILNPETRNISLRIPGKERVRQSFDRIGEFSLFSVKFKGVSQGISKAEIINQGSNRDIAVMDANYPWSPDITKDSSVTLGYPHLIFLETDSSVEAMIQEEIVVGSNQVI